MEDKKLRRIFDILRVLEKVFFRWIFPYKHHGNLTKYNNRPLVVVGNHYSIWDVVHSALLTDGSIRIIAKKELWNNAIMRKFVNLAQCIPVGRDGADVQAVKTCLRCLKNDEIIAIFPEGTRNKSYDAFLPFKGGAAAFAIKTRTPIVPVVQVQKIRPFHRAHVIYGDPIELTKYYGKKLTGEELEEIDKWLSDVMFNMRQAFIDKYNPKIKPIKTKKSKKK